MSAVLDASAAAEFLLGTPRGQAVGDRIRSETDLHAPHLVLSECVSVLRGWVLGGKLPEARAGAALDDLSSMPWSLWDVSPLIGRIWWHRHNLSAYDATYLALAEALECPLVTTDVRLARGASNARVELVTPAP